jgi:hypothetical protein
MGFIRNKYDPCVYNQVNEEREKSTIKTHVDNIKISSKTKSEVDKTILELNNIYKEITVSEGHTHYLGMVMIFDRKKKQVRINMEKYIMEII